MGRAVLAQRRAYRRVAPGCSAYSVVKVSIEALADYSAWACCLSAAEPVAVGAARKQVDVMVVPQSVGAAVVDCRSKA